MKHEFPAEVRKVLWAVTALALVLSGLVNFNQRHSFRLPDDGVVWMQGATGVEARYVVRDGAADKAGIRPGDQLKKISGMTVNNDLQVVRVLDRIGAWQMANYLIERQGIEVHVALMIGSAPLNSLANYFQWFLAFGYLLIGAVVLVRRQGHAMVAHFAAFCLVSFVLFGFSFTGRLDTFDRFIYWADVWATLLTPALFLHFCLIFPGSKRVPVSRRVFATMGYIPVVAMLLTHHLAALGYLETNLSLTQLRQLLDQVDYALLGVYFVVGAVIVGFAGWRTEALILRQQRRWLAAGSLAGVLPFTLFYIWPYVHGEIIGPNQSLSVLSLAFVPLGFAYAIFRYRLMDVEWVVRRGAVYSLATAALLGVFYGFVFVLSGLIEPRVEGIGPALWVFSVVVAALLFHPLRRQVQHFSDRRRYRERYDSRRTLIDFASELSTELDPSCIVGSVVERLKTTLDLSKVAVFVRRETDSPTGASIRLSAGWGLAGTRGKPLGPQSEIDLDFLDRAPAAGLQPPTTFSWQEEQPVGTRQVMADLGLSYYMPCQVRGRTIAFLGLSLTRDGNYLTSEDINLVRAVSGYFAIAVENSHLYESLAQKAREYEQLKDYSENIVESLSVGISAVDLEDTVESWNTQLELMFGISRQQAMGRRLADLLPAELVSKFDMVREESGVHTVYKFRLRAQDFPQEFRPQVDGSISGRKFEQKLMLNVVITPLVAKNFDRIGRLVIFDDVTDRIELEEQLVQADKLSSIGLLAAGVAHEVNTPLAVISSYAQMLAKQVESKPNQSKILQKITAQIFRASEIVNSLLHFSRTSTGDFEPVKLSTMLRDTLLFVEPQLRDAHIEIVTEFNHEVGHVMGNTGKLQQVFLNLFLNARDAMSEGGRLTVRTRAVEHATTTRAEILVSDTGSGIDPEHLKRIFDPFFTTRGPKRGTGLGLAVTYGIVQEHSGKITVESKPGDGTSFRVELPLARKPIHA